MKVLNKLWSKLLKIAVPLFGLAGVLYMSCQSTRAVELANATSERTSDKSNTVNIAINKMQVDSKASLDRFKAEQDKLLQQRDIEAKEFQLRLSSSLDLRSKSIDRSYDMLKSDIKTSQDYLRLSIEKASQESTDSHRSAELFRTLLDDLNQPGRSRGALLVLWLTYKTDEDRKVIVPAALLASQNVEENLKTLLLLGDKAKPYVSEARRAADPVLRDQANKYWNYLAVSGEDLDSKLRQQVDSFIAPFRMRLQDRWEYKTPAVKILFDSNTSPRADGTLLYLSRDVIEAINADPLQKAKVLTAWASCALLQSKASRRFPREIYVATAHYLACLAVNTALGSLLGTTETPTIKDVKGPNVETVGARILWNIGIAMQDRDLAATAAVAVLRKGSTGSDAGLAGFLELVLIEIRKRSSTTKAQEAEGVIKSAR